MEKENVKKKTSRKKKRNTENKLGKVLVLVLVIAVSMLMGWLVADMTETTYSVAFDVGNGTSSTVLKVEGKSNILKPADPTREGYIFEGWYVGDERFDFNKEVTEDITLTAKWTKIEEDEKIVTYTVTFNSNSGSSVAPQTVETGKNAIEPVKPTRSGYTFNGWYNGNVKYDFTSKVTADITLTANWTKIEENKSDNTTDNKTQTVTKYTVKFNYGYSNKVTTKSVEKGKTVAQPANPTRSGYKFLGWYNGNTKFVFSTKITSNITLTAKWEKQDVITYKVEDIPNSVANQQMLYVLKNGVKVAGTVSITNTAGKTVTRTVPATGITIVKGTYTKISNVKAN